MAEKLRRKAKAFGKRVGWFMSESRLFKLLTMEEGPEREEVARRMRYTLSEPITTTSVPRKFKDEANHSKRIIGDLANAHKSELEIEKEIESYLIKNRIEFWNTKVKGEIHSIGHGRAIMKASKNKGFIDILCCIQGYFVGIEVKKPKGIQSLDQLATEKRIKKAGGKYFIVTSVRELEVEFKRWGYI